MLALLNAQRSEVIDPDRHKRAIFGGGGKFLNWFLGTATEDQVSTLFAHMQKVEGYINSTAKNRVEDSKKLNAFMKLSTNRISNLFDTLDEHASALNASIRGISLMQKEVSILKDTEQWLVNHMERLTAMVGKLMSISIANINVLDLVTVYTTSWVEGIQKLIMGSLPLELITSTMLNSALKDVRRVLMHKHPAFKNIYHYFQHSLTPKKGFIYH